VAGRWESGWLRNPLEYTVPTYAADMVTLIAQLGVEELHWLGTSMGGLIGMMLAALPGTPVTRLVLNDVGLVVSGTSLARIGSYVGKSPQFPSFEAAVAYVRTVSAPFGPHSDAQWRTLTEHVVRREPNGRYRMHYDPAIVVPIAASRRRTPKSGRITTPSAAPRCCCGERSPTCSRTTPRRR
jgi:pimeloyl-ACP methyl ester carboxylesterase